MPAATRNGAEGKRPADNSASPCTPKKICVRDEGSDKGKQKESESEIKLPADRTRSFKTLRVVEKKDGEETFTDFVVSIRQVCSKFRSRGYY
jgi:hypothetical protein